MKYKEALPNLKKFVKERTGAQRVSFSLTRYRSGGGGTILDITTWSRAPVMECLRTSIMYDELPKLIKELNIEDLWSWREGPSIHLLCRVYEAPLSEARQWRLMRVDEVEAMGFKFRIQPGDFIPCGEQ